MKRSLALCIVAALCISPGASAATSKPTPKPTIKITTKVVPEKKSPQPTSKATARAKATANASKKPVVKSTKKASTTKATTTKATTKKKVVKKPRKPVRVTASPKPTWPPKGFYSDKASGNDVYARIPTTKELIGVISARESLSKRVAECEKSACGAVQVGSFIGCTWWEVTSTLFATDSQKTRQPIGSLRTLVGKSEPQQILTILLISKEPIAEGQIMDNISVNCHRDTPTDEFPQYFYTPIAG